MEKITDRLSEVTNSIKERISNPFIFSFILSWLIWNWKITIGLFWLSNEQLQTLGYKSLFDLIALENSRCGSFKIPLITSIFITLALPLLRIIFSIVDAAITALGNTGYFWITKKGNISTERYIELREKSLKLHKQLQKVIDSESDYKLKYEEIVKENQTMRESVDVVNSMNDANFLQGSWELRNITQIKTYVLKVVGHNVTISDDGKDVGTGHIGFFFRDTRQTERIFFQINRTDIQNVSQVYSLSKEDLSSYKGVENNQHEVLLRRIQ